VSPRRATGVAFTLAAGLLAACGRAPEPPISHCLDGVRDADETGVDCGGSCQPCAAPSATPAPAPPRPLPGGGPGTAQSVLDKLAGSRPYNGIDPLSGGRFWETWPLVTVRYRKDNGELRFVYANEVAMRALAAGEKYPDGAIITKIAAVTEGDPLFPNSAVPSAGVRIQFMVKDAVKYAATDGWGYAIFPDDARGGTDLEGVQSACHACHRLAASLDFVFSRPAFGKVTAPPPITFRTRFVPADAAALDASGHRALEMLAPGFRGQLFQQKMDLFAGSLYESLGPLLGYVDDEKAIFLLVGARTRDALVAKPLPPRPDCAHPARVVFIHERRGAPDQVRQGEACAGVVAWNDAPVGQAPTPGAPAGAPPPAVDPLGTRR
jgi:hypothetical protein